MLNNTVHKALYTTTTRNLHVLEALHRRGCGVHSILMAQNRFTGRLQIIIHYAHLQLIDLGARTYSINLS